jgi:hypothetical protein
MHTKVHHLCAAVALASAALGAAANANAGCLSYGLKPASYGAPDTNGLLLTSGDAFVSIVGMWHVTFTSKGNEDLPKPIPDGAPMDDAFATWHADGTEIMNSARPPATQSFCTGVWKQIGKSTYRLRHIAISWKYPDDGGTVPEPEGPAEIHETVTLDRTGNHFTGFFTIDQYETGEAGTAETGTPIHLTGTLTGDRITVN